VVAIVLGAAVIAGAVLGFAFSPPAGVAGPEPLGRHASSGAVQISYPSGWRQRPVPAWFSLPLTDAVALGPAARGGVLVVGRAPGADAGLLPAQLLASSSSAPTGAEVTIAGRQFDRYLDVSLRGGHGPASVYAMSTTQGLVLGVCVPQGRSPSLLGSCERSLATLTLSQGRVLAPAPIPSYASQFDRAIGRLVDVRAQLASNLAKATVARAQATAAYALAGAHLRAASALMSVNAGSAATANEAIIAALQGVSGAYRHVGDAALKNNRGLYDRARTSVRTADGVLTAALGRLATFGYTTG
jgi:hypothetical protein